MALAKAVAYKAPVVLQFTAGPNAALLTLPNVGLMTVDDDMEIMSVTERHETLGTDGGAVTVDVVKASSGTALASGTSLLASTISLKATINTTQSRTLAAGTLASTAAGRTVLAGQCIGLKFSGTMTAVTGVCITVVLKRRSRPSW